MHNTHGIITIPKSNPNQTNLSLSPFASSSPSPVCHAGLGAPMSPLPTNLTNFFYTAETSTPQKHFTKCSGHDHIIEVSMLLELYTKIQKSDWMYKTKRHSLVPGKENKPYRKPEESDRSQNCRLMHRNPALSIPGPVR